MQRAQKQCQTCPFRGVSEHERRELAVVPPDYWECHTEAGYTGGSGIQCRGHWEARRKYPPTSWLAVVAVAVTIVVASKIKRS